jgi:hypothetical protein
MVYQEENRYLSGGEHSPFVVFAIDGRLSPHFDRE